MSMKKIVYFLSFLFLFFSYFMDLALSECSPYTPCCCQEYPGGDDKCFTDGFCCLFGEEQYWNPNSCYDFKFWVEPKQVMFTVGRKTTVNLYIQNTGGYADNYNITYEKYDVNPPNPSLIQVDMSDISPVNDVARGEIRRVYPMITVLEISTTGKVFFNATSQTDKNIYRNTTLTVLPSEFAASLPEFDFFGLTGLVILAGFVYYKKRKKLA